MTNIVHASLAELLAHVEKKDWYALLGVGSHASVDGIKLSYLELVRRCHPDVFRSPEDKALAKRVSDALVEAWLTLSDATKRAAYDRQRSGRTLAVPKATRDPRAEAELARLVSAPLSVIGARRVEVAKLLHQHGAILFSHRDHVEAERYLRRAYELDPSVPEHGFRLGWALFSNRNHPDAIRLVEARAVVGHAVAIDPYHSDGRYTVACICREMGQHDQYRLELEAALRGRTKHPRAEQEIEALKAKEVRAAEAVQRYDEVKAKETSGFSLKRLLSWSK